MASRNPDDLHPYLKKLWEDHQKRFEELMPGCQLFLTCTYRSNEEQAALYAQGRTKPGPIVTKALPGQSYHNHKPALAYDVAVLVNGKLDWNTKGEAWKAIKKTGITCGLEGLSFELAHFQLPQAVLKTLGIKFPK